MRSMLVDIGLLLLRLGIGCTMLIAHGIPKIQNFGSLRGDFFDPMGVGSSTSLILAIAAEVGASVLLILGLMTRVALIPLIGTMIVAHFIYHGSDAWKVKELSAIYLMAYTALLVSGPGRLALDTIVWRKGKKKD